MTAGALTVCVICLFAFLVLASVAFVILWPVVLFMAITSGAKK